MKSFTWNMKNKYEKLDKVSYKKEEKIQEKTILLHEVTEKSVNSYISNSYLTIW